MRTNLAWLVLVIAAVCIIASDSSAQLPGQENVFKRSERFWKLRDVCARASQKQFPDYTAEGNAKRERSYRQCLEANNLPFEPSSPNESPGSSHR